MATTSSTLMAGKVASQGDNGSNGRYGLKAKLATGLTILGVAATLAFGGAQIGNTARSQPLAAQSATSMVDWEQVERAQVAPSRLVAISDWEHAERSHVAPGLPAAAPVAPTQFGPQDYLPGEEPGAGGGTPSPTFGPQP